MSITIDIDPELLQKAQAALKTDDAGELVRRLVEQAVRQHEAEQRLIARGGTMPDLEMPRRDRGALPQP